MIKEESETVSARIPSNLRKAMQRMIYLDTHLNESDFIRSAIREKIKNEAPHLVNDLLKQELAA